MRYRREWVDHIAAEQKLDPKLEWLASRLYGRGMTASCHYGCGYDGHDINPPCGTVREARTTVAMILKEAETEGLVTRNA